ncbi:MAG TPA: TetR/AcrR family transcriptional regulator [Duganella sp.]|uniref:TetR/AcrR family transcriptional regulator n=1 Tax=Duganella sp. TaxID=1904440 RepID=UPI002ECFF51D
MKMSPPSPAPLQQSADGRQGARPKLRGRPGKERAATIDADILAIATAMFGEIGYAATSMEAVAARAGITKRTLYLRYPGKSELFKNVIDAIVMQAMKPQPTDFADLRACLGFHVENYYLVRRDPAMRVITNMADMSVQNLPELAALAQEFTHELGTRRIATSIADTARMTGVDVGDPEFIANALLDLAGGHFSRADMPLPGAEPATRESTSGRIVRLLMAGLGVGKQSSEASR